MSIFKKIDFSQFLADLITFQCDFLENNFNKLVVLADEFKVLTEKDKEEFLDKAHELIIVDILMSCNQHFYKTLSSEEVGEAVSIVYAKYLTEYKKISKTLAEKKLERAMELFDLVCKAEEETQKRDKHYKEIGYKSYPKIGSDVDKQKFYLSSGFASYCVGHDIKSENWEGKNFAAFKLAKGFVKADIVKTMLKEFKIIWN
jgi:hypothetical protein